MDNKKVAGELIKLAKELTAKFPPKAADFNKIKDTDGFWKWDIKEAMKYSGTRFKPNDIGDVIFFLNMAADAWERQMKNN